MCFLQVAIATFLFRTTPGKLRSYLVFELVLPGKGTKLVARVHKAGLMTKNDQLDELVRLVETTSHLKHTKPTT